MSLNAAAKAMGGQFEGDDVGIKGVHDRPRLLLAGAEVLYEVRRLLRRVVEREVGQIDELRLRYIIALAGQYLPLDILELALGELALFLEPLEEA